MHSDGLRRAIDLVGWIFAANVGVVMITQVLGVNGIPITATLQALTPYLVIALAPVAGVASYRGTHRLAVTSSLVGIGGLILAAPLVLPAGQPAPDADATEVSVAAVNLLFKNQIIDDVGDVLLAQDADVILFTEYTAEHQAALLDHPFADQYPHKIERDGLRAGGIALFSRYPVTEGARPETVNYTLDVTMEGPDGAVRIFGVHPPTPLSNLAGWIADLELLATLGEQATAPTLIIGDFNASYWHPPFRDLLHQGFTDAHTTHGKGFSASWPTDRAFPAFVRLDHALTGNGLVSTGVEDFTVPGSDHRGFVVTVGVAR